MAEISTSPRAYSVMKCEHPAISAALKRVGSIERHLNQEEGPPIFRGPFQTYSSKSLFPLQPIGDRRINYINHAIWFGTFEATFAVSATKVHRFTLCDLVAHNHTSRLVPSSDYHSSEGYPILESPQRGATLGTCDHQLNKPVFSRWILLAIGGRLWYHSDKTTALCGILSGSLPCFDRLG